MQKEKEQCICESPLGSCDLVGLGWLSSGFPESSQPCTLQQEGQGSVFFQNTGQCKRESGTACGMQENVSAVLYSSYLCLQKLPCC